MRLALRAIGAMAVFLLAAAIAGREGCRFAADAYAEAGLRRFRQGRFEDSLEAYDRAIGLFPGSVDARYRRGGAYTSLAALAAARGDLAQAKRHLDRAGDDLVVVREVAPNFADLNYRLGVVRCEQGRDAEAVPPLREAVRRDPKLADARLRLARSLLRTGSAEEASSAAEEAARRDPWNAEAHATKARAERALGHAMEAVEFLRDAEACAPRDASLRWIRSGWLADLGRIDEAFEEAFVAACRGGAAAVEPLRSFQARFPNDPRATLILATALRASGDRRECLDLYGRFAREGKPESRQTEALRRAASGDFEGAAQLFAALEAEVMARLCPEFLGECARAVVLGHASLPDFREPETRRRFAGTLVRFGRDDLAVPLLEEAVRDEPGCVLRRLVLAEAYFRLERLSEARVHAQECLRQGFADYRAEDDPAIDESDRMERALGPRLLKLAASPDAVPRGRSPWPRDAHGYYRTGLLHVLDGEPDKADPFFLAALRYDPANLLAAARIREPSAEAGARSFAVQALGVRAMRLLGVILEKAGDAEGAWAQFDFADREAARAGMAAAARLSGSGFCAGDPAARPFLRVGFDEDETLEDGRPCAYWVGRSAEVLVDLARPAREVRFDLAAKDLSPLHQEVSVWIGGVRLARFEVGPEVAEFRVDLGSERTGVLRLRLEARYAISPWEWSGGGFADRRPLGAALSRVLFR